MRKVKNQMVIRRLSDKSFQSNQTRNKIAILAVALTAMLFTALFTIGLGTIENFQLQTMRQSGGDSHGVFKDLTREQYETLSKHPLIKESAPCMVVADTIDNPEFLKRHVEAWYYPKEHYPHCFVDIIDGRAPEKADEILLDDTSMKLLGLEPTADQMVTFDMKIRDIDNQVIKREFHVVGVTKSDSAMNVGFIIVSDAYLEKYQSELSYQTDKTGSLTGAIRMDVSFSNAFSIQKKLDQVIEESGYSLDETNPNYIASNANWAYVSDGAGGDSVTTGAIIASLCLIILTGYLIIYNVFQISIMKDIRYYGLLKTIGTTGKQIKKIIRRQARKLCLIGIPIGLILGFFIGRWIVPFMMRSTSYGNGEVVVSANPAIFIGAAFFAFFTVFISQEKPARIAAKVSPIEALRYTEGSKKKNKNKKSMDGGKIWKMSLSNLGRSKGKTVVIILSLSLAVVLLNSVFTITRSFDMDTYLKKFVSYDFLIGNAKYFRSEYYATIEEEMKEMNLTESFIKQCEQLSGFEEGGRIYGTMSRVGLKKDSWKVPDYVTKDQEGNLGEYWGGQFIPFHETQEGDYGVSFYGLEDLPLSKIEVWKGEKDFNIMKEKLATGNYLLAAVQIDDNDFVYEEEVRHQVGDKIKLNFGNGQEKEFTILSLIKENYYGLSNRIGANFAYYTTADIFKGMLSDEFLMSYGFQVENSKENEVDQFLKAYTEEIEPLMNYESKFIYLEDFNSLKALFILVGGVLAMVIGIIGILNFINSILTGIVTRRREFAMMEAIGMTRKQLSQMVVLEGIYYGIFTCAFSIIFGCIFSLTAVRALSTGLWFMKYHFIILPMLIVLPIMLLLGILVPKIVFHFNTKQSIVEQLRDNE